MILGSAEAAIAPKFVEAVSTYDGYPLALQLRAMNIVYAGPYAGAITRPLSGMDTDRPAMKLRMLVAIVFPCVCSMYSVSPSCAGSAFAFLAIAFASSAETPSCSS